MAVCRRGAGRGRGRRACGRAGRHRRSPVAASGTPRRTRPTPGTCGAAGRGPAAGVLGPAGADPGVPGAAGDLPRPAPRAHRLGAAHSRGVLPPGRPAAGRGRAAHRAGPGRAAGGRGRTCRRAGSCRSPPPWTCSPPLEARLEVLRHAAAGCRPASDRREGAGRAAVWGRAGHRAGADLLAGRGGPVLLLPQGGPVRRAGHHRLVFGPQGPARAPVPAGTAGAALGGL